MNERIRHHYRQISLDLQDAGGFIAMAVFFFLIGGVVGFFSPGMGRQLVESFGELVQGLVGRGPLELMLIIFLRNAMVGLLSILLGVALGIFPLFAAVTNGMLLGAVLGLFPGEAWRVIPHGVFELPAIFIAWGLGLWCGAWLFQARRSVLIKDRLRRSLRAFAGLVLPLLLVASVVEVLGVLLLRS